MNVEPTVRVGEAAFDVGAETAALTAGRADVGGVASFVGVCRGDDGPDQQKLAALVLEHYPGMTERALRRIAAEACARWPLTGCTVVHRVGRIVPGEGIVLVLTASAHRVAALEACAFLIDWLKTRAPFWKREEFAGGTDRWVAARGEDDARAAAWEGGASGASP
ncbi:molybdenum cofactor biosynthesis protein MoaE [Roseomonas sp. CCTCC AB2023176]|uniref:molybdenum cofactor biosynthesis protein MoaE n=1 Tax=Roseomonas sp. CCTCC AB2023176 TaxID=3342640 RepID=UPI0035DD15EA